MSQLGFEYAVESAKSLVISCALAEKQISVEKATSLSRLEVEFQVSVAQVFVVGCSHVKEFSEGTVYIHYSFLNKMSFKKCYILPLRSRFSM